MSLFVLKRGQPSHLCLGLSSSHTFRFCVCVSRPSGVQVSEVSKASPGQLSMVSTSGPLRSVGRAFEREGRCSTFHLLTGGALCPPLPFLFSTIKLELPTALIIPPLVSTVFCVCALCWKPPRATLTLGVFMEQRRGWYPDVNVWFSLKRNHCVCVWGCTQCTLNVWCRFVMSLSRVISEQ